MAGWTLVKMGFRDGVWVGRLSGPAADAPRIEVTSGDEPVAGAQVQDDGAGAWLLSVPIPATCLGDGIASFLVTDKRAGDVIAGFCIAVGDLADEDLRAEVALLRGELDMLKRAFRRLASKSD